jgi:hypothetical protein
MTDVHIEYDSGQTLVTTAETVIGTFPALEGTPPSVTPYAGQGIPTLVSGNVNVTPGAAATGIIVRIRQGSLTGAVIGTPAETDTVAASVPVDVPFEGFDPAGATTYVVTVQQVAATGNGTVNVVSADAIPQ